MKFFFNTLLAFPVVLLLTGCKTTPSKEINYSQVGSMKVWITPEYSSSQDKNNYIHTSIVQ